MGVFCKKVDLSSTQGYSISIFLHFTYLGVRTHPTHPPPSCLRAWPVQEIGSAREKLSHLRRCPDRRRPDDRWRRLCRRSLSHLDDWTSSADDLAHQPINHSQTVDQLATEYRTQMPVVAASPSAQVTRYQNTISDTFSLQSSMPMVPIDSQDMTSYLCSIVILNLRGTVVEF